MKYFTSSDFIQQATDEGFTYFSCIMANGMELQIDPQDWGWRLGIYSIDGRLIAKDNQPYLLGLSGLVQIVNSRNVMLSRLSSLYHKTVHTKVIKVNYA